MLFRSREKPDLWARLRTAMWPRVSWQRSLQYFRKRVLRLSGTPHSVALGVALGVSVACTPFFGLHTIIAIAIAFLVGGNLVAAALGTAFGNPLTYPFIWASTDLLGHLIVGGKAPHFRHLAWLKAPLAEFKPMLVGSVPLGLVAGLVAYIVVVMATSAFQNMRRQRLAETRRQQKIESASRPQVVERT
jgi:uncharacterized protein (DUF2062 family)